MAGPGWLAAMRRLEVRIGELLGPADNRGPATLGRDLGLGPDERHDFREMASHPEVVEAVIAESTDEEPASRRKVLEGLSRGDRTLVRAITAVALLEAVVRIWDRQHGDAGALAEVIEDIRTFLSRRKVRHH